jgi:hypothetical protein
MDLWVCKGCQQLMRDQNDMKFYFTDNRRVIDSPGWCITVCYDCWVNKGYEKKFNRNQKRYKNQILDITYRPLMLEEDPNRQ